MYTELLLMLLLLAYMLTVTDSANGLGQALYKLADYVHRVLELITLVLKTSNSTVRDASIY